MAQLTETFTNRHRSRVYTTLGVILGGTLIISATGTAGKADGDGAHGADNSAVTVTAPRVVIMKAKRVLHLFDGERLMRSYPIDLGTEPLDPKEHKGDGRTPVGVFRVVSKNADSPFHQFIGLDYPDLTATEQGLARGLVSPGEAASILRSLAAGRCPDWGTELGGGIGIHGQRIGKDWTGGCIALSDEHVEELFSVLRIGDTIEVLR